MTSNLSAEVGLEDLRDVARAAAARSVRSTFNDASCAVSPGPDARPSRGRLSSLGAGFLRIEHPQNNAFPMHRRHRRDAEIDRRSADRQLDSAVLGQSPFRDVQLGHELDARYHGGAKAIGRRIDVAQCPIDAQAEAIHLCAQTLGHAMILHVVGDFEGDLIAAAQ